ncbi:hypothetical protein WR25_09503 [Diploscapter pachys]|uniref:Uncharacterized protein n=1 Tax=Diploscapter pachys TaxID=2018661 RepID=A0A2A2J3W1_9BILA|nr:hypothetical protein WR25_09503 [Diploscapter pachys]
MAAGKNHTVIQTKTGEMTQNRQKIENETGTEMEADKRSGFEMGRKGEGRNEGGEGRAAGGRDREPVGRQPQAASRVMARMPFKWSATVSACIHTSQWFTNYDLIYAVANKKPEKLE